MDSRTPSRSALLGKLAAPAPTIIVFLALVMFQLGLAQFLGNPSRFSLIGIAYYAYFSAAIACAALLLVTDKRARSWPVPLLVFGALSLSPVVLRGLGSVERTYLVEWVIIGCMAVLLPCTNIRSLLAGAAVLTGINAALCIAGLLLPALQMSGRATGLLVNPNIAAESILLGVLVSYRALPELAAKLLVAIGAAAILATVSRSTILTGVAVFAFALIALALQGRRLNFSRATLAAGIVFLALAAVALSSPGFRGAANAAGKGAVTGVAASGQPGDSVQLGGNLPTATIDRIQKLAAKEGAENSLSARIDLLKYADILIRARPLTGYGLTNAQSFIPHNTIALFMLAFGVAGAVIPLGLVALMVWGAWPRLDSMAVPLAFFILMFGSHDLLLSNTLVIYIPLAFAAIKQPQHEKDRPSARS